MNRVFPAAPFLRCDIGHTDAALAAEVRPGVVALHTGKARATLVLRLEFHRHVLVCPDRRNV